ncbi:MAG: hypothetical protein F6J94_11255 [Moorea sp. SIO1F2]|nr:hypothetical protein [Moorena sp. SIO1F2]
MGASQCMKLGKNYNKISTLAILPTLPAPPPHTLPDSRFPIPDSRFPILNS